MLDKGDKKFISQAINNALVNSNKVFNKALSQRLKEYDRRLDEKFKENNEYLVKETVSLFNATNEAIEETRETVDKILDEVKGINSDIDNHERRIGKIEEKVFAV